MIMTAMIATMIEPALPDVLMIIQIRKSINKYATGSKNTLKNGLVIPESTPDKIRFSLDKIFNCA